MARILTIIFSLVAISSIMILITREFSPLTGVLSGLFFGFSPIIFYYGSAIQPDVPALSLALVSLALMAVACRSVGLRQWILYYLSALAMGLGILIKMPVITFGLPLLLMLVQYRQVATTARNPLSWGYPLVALVPGMLWYLHARKLQEQSGLRYFYLGKGWGELLHDWLSLDFYTSIFARMLFDVYVFALVAAGALVTLWLFRHKLPLWFKGLVVSSIAYLFLAGHHAAHHSYYGVPVVPVLAIAAAFGAQELFKRQSKVPQWALVAMAGLVVMAHGLGRTWHWSKAWATTRSHQMAKQFIDNHAAPSDRILLFSASDPTLLWWLDRKGWIAPSEKPASWFARTSLRPPLVVIDHRRVPPPVRASLTTTLAAEKYRRLLEGPPADCWLHFPKQESLHD